LFQRRRIDTGEPLFPAARYGLDTREAIFMKPIMILGIVLIVLGIGGLAFRSISWTETNTVADIGPLKIQAEEQHNVWIPTAAAIAAVLAGLGLVIVGRKAA
jgi:hypothetical protein